MNPIGTYGNHPQRNASFKITNYYYYYYYYQIFICLIFIFFVY